MSTAAGPACCSALFDLIEPDFARAGASGGKRCGLQVFRFAVQIGAVETRRWILRRARRVKVQGADSHAIFGKEKAVP